MTNQTPPVQSQSKQGEGVRLCFECRGSGVVGMYPDKRPCVVCGGTGDRTAKEGRA